MATEGEEALIALQAEDWSAVLGAVDRARALLSRAPPGDHDAERIIEALVPISEHSKWEVRRAVANLAAHVNHRSFGPALERLVRDDNALVAQAARRASLRRRDWQSAGVFGRQHEARINSTLDDIESRFGSRGRQAVRRASDQIADTFARELYHEVIKLVAPLASSADRLHQRLVDPTVAREQLAGDAETIRRRVARLKDVLDAMRAYTASPELSFAAEDVCEVVLESIGLVEDGTARALLPRPVLGDPVLAEVCRARLVQALVNVLTNAVEAYGQSESKEPIRVAIERGAGAVAIVVEDFGCGMSREVLADASVLFTTSKPEGTGFGLPLAVKIVEAEHDGRLSLESERGRGTMVRVVLPTSRTRGDR